MIHRRLVIKASAAGLLIGGALLASGCGTDDGQPARGSISAPRKGGGAVGAGGASAKAGAAGAPAGKVGGKLGAQ
jgi:hypothetical protein